jgi:hypothetical protein
MLSGWTAAQTVVLIVAVVALLGSLFSTVYTVRAQRQRTIVESRIAAAAEEIDRCRRQLSEFYRPLQKHRASSEFLRGLLPDHPWRLVHHLPETKRTKNAAIVDMILEEGDKIVDIVKAYIVHHQYGPNHAEVRDCFLLFVRHHILLRDAWARLGEHRERDCDVNDKDLQSSDVPFPLNLDYCIAKEVEDIQAKLAKLHGAYASRSGRGGASVPR